ncbi:hypothetical protein Tco_0269796 [Tanacetum coccineum]
MVPSNDGDETVQLGVPVTSRRQRKVVRCLVWSARVRTNGRKGGDHVKGLAASACSLSTLHFLKFPENSFEVLKLLENSMEVLKILENKLESMKILENKLESLKL